MIHETMQDNLHLNSQIKIKNLLSNYEIFQPIQIQVSMNTSICIVAQTLIFTSNIHLYLPVFKFFPPFNYTYNARQAL